MDASLTITPASLCRLGPRERAAIVLPRGTARGFVSCAVLLATAGFLYGASFGFWRSPDQTIYAAVKMPALLFAVAAVSAAANAMLAQVLGLEISRRQTLLFNLAGFAITATILAAISPVFFFIAATLPPPGSPGDHRIYCTLLTLHTTAVAFAGFAGYAKIFSLLRVLAPTRALATRVLVAWIFVAGLAGSELSWIFTPMLARPREPVPSLNPNAFRMNMYEYLWRQWRVRNFQSLEKSDTQTSNRWNFSSQGIA
jgi:hypothetical protein